MNATYTDEITSIISNLRNSIYNSDAFIQNTINKLNASGYNPVFSYDPAGGINILITIDDFNINAINEYIIEIKSAIYSAIRTVNPDMTITNDILSILFNIIYAGNNTLMVKL